MNTANIKSYAPKARRDFIQAVTEKAHLLGLSEDHIEPVEIKGDIAIIAGRPYPKKVGQIRQELENRIKRDGFELTMRAMAYTWFNRFVAIRYMELHDYLDHGFRVLSNRSGTEIPEILEHATDVDLPSLDKEEVVRLRLAGDKDNDLFQLLVVAQCNALSRAMPFLFEKIGGYTELLLPDSLLHSNSPARNLVNEIPEEDWQQIEIIGWIYQFYISEKKNEVIGKVVKSEDIPAATQLFTPNWIVKYMVQNSLGAQWLATYPDSPLKGKMDYYIEPAEQTDEVKAQLAAITPSTLNPEELTLIDPACGSGHILVEAYDLFKTIYLERGYRQRDVAQLILEKNLFGLDIDGRAAQLTGFALMMKGRVDDRRFFERDVTLNVMALVDSTGFDAEQLAKGVELGNYGLQLADLTELKLLFEHATTFGSLIQVPEGLVAKLPALKQLIEAARQDLFVSDAPKRLGPLVQQAEMLAAQYDAVVANPPYMGSKFHIPVLKKFLKDHYKGYEKDVFSAFIDRDLTFSKPYGRLGFMSPFVWMFISSHEHLRMRLIGEETIASLVQLEYSGFEGATVPICTFTIQKGHVNGQKGCYIRLSDFRGSGNQGPKMLEATRNRDCGWLFEVSQKEFNKIPGSPLAYWPSASMRESFMKHKSLAEVARPKQGLATTNNDKFLRRWWECATGTMKFDAQDAADVMSSGATWFPCQKGGSFRKWFGNNEYVVNWQSNGQEIKSIVTERYGSASKRVVNEHLYFRQGVTWSSLSSSSLAMRFVSSGHIFETKGSMCFFKSEKSLFQGLGFCNSCIVNPLIKCVSPTLDFHEGPVGSLPIAEGVDSSAVDIAKAAVNVAQSDWNAYERSWDFQSLPILSASTDPTPTLEFNYTSWISKNRETIAEMKRLEEENNRLFIDAYGLADELTPDVPIEQITITVNPVYRYGGKLTEGELWTRFRQDTMKELVSYAIGCMMGRYSLDEPGLIYAHRGNEKFNEIYYNRKGAKSAKKEKNKKPLRPSRLCGENISENSPSFPPDDDGIIPITDIGWFSDDATNRFIEFLKVAWSFDTLGENLRFIADTLGPKRGEDAHFTIRRYFANSFFKDHLKTYKKRPIYWLFTSGKEKAFQCLVYLHRYNESTLSRMRGAYVTPLFGKFNARLEYLQNEREAAATASAKKKIQKEIDGMKKKLAELSSFDDELRHYAYKRISLDLDDGVKVNYGKFGNLLAEKKMVTGKK